jgi:hypothetical protein
MEYYDSGFMFPSARNEVYRFSLPNDGWGTFNDWSRYVHAVASGPYVGERSNRRNPNRDKIKAARRQNRRNRK